jgi:hypothetical protein
MVLRDRSEKEEDCDNEEDAEILTPAMGRGKY